METAQIIATLTDSGFDQKAAAIYVTLLGKNRLGIAEIARESGVKRATCYEHIESLLKNDFVVRVPVGKRMYYAATDPKKVLETYRRRTADLETKLGVLVELHERATNKPRVTFYEGKREIGRIYTELFSAVGDTYSIFPPSAFFESFTEDEFEAFEKENSAHAFKTKDLFVASVHTKRLRELRRKRNFDNKSDKVLPDWFETNVDVLIFNETVALISLRDLSAVVIENRDIASLFRQMHTFIWKAL